MKLRSIALTDVRRFAGRTASLSGIGDGITVLAEANEFGKSTFFDALYAVFFEKHRARGAEIKKLQPYGGGAPSVRVEVEVASGRFAIEKRWLTKAMARVTDAQGRQIAADDEAEVWIDRLVLGGLAGPAGLLWVRQGVMTLDPTEATKSERDQSLDARRALLSSVAGEIDLMTGGRRMDAVLRRVDLALADLVTATGKPKAGGPYATVLAEGERLGVEIAGLSDKVSALGADLAARREAESRLQRSEDPVEEAARRAALTEAQGRFAAAQNHADRLARAEQALALAQSQLALAERDRDALNQLDADLARASAEAARVTALEALAKAADAASRAALDQHERAAQQAQATLDAAQRRQDVAQRAALARQAQDRLGDLSDRLIKADALRLQIETAEAKLGQASITPAQVQAIADAELALALLLAEQNAAAPRLSVEYSGDMRLKIGDQTLDPHAELAVPQRVQVQVPGIGVLTIDPGRRSSEDAAERQLVATARLTQALARAGCPSLSVAQGALADAATLRAEVQQLHGLLAQIAPQGIGPLRVAHAEADRIAGTALPGGSVEVEAPLATDLATAQRISEDCQQALRHAVQVARNHGEALAAAVANVASAGVALMAVQTRAGDAAARQARRQEVLQTLDRLQSVVAGAKADRQALFDTAPDIATAKAILARTQSAVERNLADRQGLRERLLELNTRITAQSEAGLEETLAERQGQWAAAQTKASAYQAEVAGLLRLKRALDTARAEARDAYFEPVKQELQPLLAILHPDAELLMDDQKLLPSTLRRGPHDEPLDMLSGGTREQLAILTRLAFARLLARSGSVVPIILDDALVHSDDDRIVAMFTALHRVAQDQQILVFTCRQRAFADLGGVPVQVVIS